MLPQRFWTRLCDAVAAWQADSGDSDYRDVQRKAKTGMWRILWEGDGIHWEYLPTTTGTVPGLRLWLVDVSDEMAGYTLPAGCTIAEGRLCRSVIPDTLADWQMVAFDRLRHIGVDGAYAEFCHQPGNPTSWWITVCWESPVGVN